MRRVNLGRKSYSRRRSGHWSAISSPRRYGFSEGLFEIPLLYGHRTLYTLRNEDGSHVRDPAGPGLHTCGDLRDIAFNLPGAQFSPGDS